MRDPLGDRRRRQGIAHLVVGPRLGEHDPADGAVRQHQRTAAVAALDVRADLDDVAAHVLGRIDVPPEGRVRVGDRRGDDAQRAAARVAQDGCRRPSFRVVSGEVAGPARADRARAAARRRARDRTRPAWRRTSRLRPFTRIVRPPAITWALVRTYPGATTNPLPVDSRPHVPACDPQRARLGHGRDRQRLRIIGPLDGRSRERLEPDEHVRQPRRVQEPPQFERQLVGRRQRVIQRSHDGRGLGRLGEARHRPEREQAAGQPQDEQRLDAGDQPAAESVNAAEDALPEPRSQPCARSPSRSTRR